jgi:hypothetical protein
MARAKKEKEGNVQRDETVKEKELEVQMEEPAVKETVSQPEETAAQPVLTKEQKIINYIESAKGGDVDLVPFLKSLYPLAAYGEQAVYLSQGESKRLRVLLQAMKNEGKITLKDEGYLRLGTSFYADSDAKTKYYTLDNTKINVTK